MEGEGGKQDQDRAGRKQPLPCAPACCECPLAQQEGKPRDERGKGIECHARPGRADLQWQAAPDNHAHAKSLKPAPAAAGEYQEHEPSHQSDANNPHEAGIAQVLNMRCRL